MSSESLHTSDLYPELEMARLLAQAEAGVPLFLDHLSTNHLGEVVTTLRAHESVLADRIAASQRHAQLLQQVREAANEAHLARLKRESPEGMSDQGQSEE